MISWRREASHAKDSSTRDAGAGPAGASPTHVAESDGAGSNSRACASVTAPDAVEPAQMISRFSAASNAHGAAKRGVTLPRVRTIRQVFAFGPESATAHVSEKAPKKDSPPKTIRRSRTESETTLARIRANGDV